MGTRFLLAGAVLLAGVLLAPRADGVPDDARQAGTAALCGLFLLVGGNGLVAVAEQDVDSGLAALLIAGTPLWVVLLRALLRDRPSAATVPGLLLGLAGVAVLLLPGISGAAALGPLLLVCLSSVLWSCGTVLATRRPMPADPFVTTVVEMVVGRRGDGRCSGRSAASGAGWTSARVGRRHGSPSATWWWSAASSAYSAYVWLLARAPLSLATTYAYVNPAVAVAPGRAVPRRAADAERARRRRRDHRARSPWSSRRSRAPAAPPAGRDAVPVEPA